MTTEELPAVAQSGQPRLVTTVEIAVLVCLVAAIAVSIAQAIVQPLRANPLNAHRALCVPLQGPPPGRSMNNGWAMYNADVPGKSATRADVVKWLRSRCPGLVLGTKFEPEGSPEVLIGNSPPVDFVALPGQGLIARPR